MEITIINPLLRVLSKDAFRVVTPETVKAEVVSTGVLSLDHSGGPFLMSLDELNERERWGDLTVARAL